MCNNNDDLTILHGKKSIIINISISLIISLDNSNSSAGFGDRGSLAEKDLSLPQFTDDLFRSVILFNHVLPFSQFRFTNIILDSFFEVSHREVERVIGFEPIPSYLESKHSTFDLNPLNRTCFYYNCF